MSGQMIFFFLISAVVITGALYVVLTKNIMHAVFMHLLTMSMIAGLYILLYAEFIAAMQVLIYAGAVTAMVIFALMLTKSQNQPDVARAAVDNPQKGTSFLSAAGFLAIILYVLIPQKWPAYETAKVLKSDVAAMGNIIFKSYILPFEIIGMILLVALVGVIVLARKED